MIVVADSGPLHYLILLNQTDLLPALYGDVLVPVAVMRELSSAGAPLKVADWLASAPAWLRIQSVEPELAGTIPQHLDLSEREAIALAQAIGADLLLIDDAEGRAEARRRKLRITGTLGVLRAAAERQMVDVSAIIADLRQTNFYFDEHLIRSTFSSWLTE